MTERPLPSFGIPLGEMVISRLLESRARSSAHDRFVVYGEEEWTFAQVDEHASRLAGGLAQLGVGRGEHVGIFLANCAEFVNTYFALGKLGAAAIPVNTAYRGYMLEYLLNDTACRILVVGASLLERVREALPRLESLELVVVVGGAEDEPVDEAARVRAVPFAELYGEPLSTREDVAHDDVNCVVYTSGTTGPSKGVPLTNAHGVAKAIEVIRICDIGPDDVIYAPLPLFHSFALLRGVVAALVAGGGCALRERFSSSGFWADVRRLGATVGFCVFSIPQILKKAEPRPDDRDNPLKCMYNARHDPEFEERFGIKLVEAYGLTEAGVAMYSRLDEPARPGSCGRISEDWEVQLVDDHDVPVPVGEVGEIVLRPKYPGLITPGYLNRPEATADAFRNLWFHTGDLAAVDADGYYYFRDRKKDAIRRRGENVSSWEVEQAIVEHPSVAEAAAIPYPSPLGEDDVRVVLTLRPDAEATPEEILAHCTQRMPDFMVPRYLEIVAELPRTPTGRVEKYRLRESPLGPDVLDRGDPREAASARR